VLRSLVIQVSRGTSNNLFQVATLVRAATALEARVDVLFCGEALGLLRSGSINEPVWSTAYSKVIESMQARLREADFVDMQRFLRDAKEHGDHVHFWGCTETMRERALTLGDFTSLLDGERTIADFTAQAGRADAMLSF